MGGAPGRLVPVIWAGYLFVWVLVLAAVVSLVSLATSNASSKEGYESKITNLFHG